MVPKIFTVTCLRDFDIFCLHCQSIKKFLNAKEFNIIVNESNTNVKKWLELYFYNKIDKIFEDKINVNIINSDVIIPPGRNDWVSQQIIKLSTLDKDDNYIVLDSGNIFVRPINIQDIKPFVKIKLEWLKNYRKFADICYTIFPVEWCRDSATPHIINPKVCEKIFDKFNGYHNFIKWFYTHDHPSEFILHSMAEQFFNMETDRDTHHGENIEFFNENLLESVYQSKIQYVKNNDSIKLIKISSMVYFDDNFTSCKKEILELIK